MDESRAVFSARFCSRFRLWQRGELAAWSLRWRFCEQAGEQTFVCGMIAQSDRVDRLLAFGAKCGPSALPPIRIDRAADIETLESQFLDLFPAPLADRFGPADAITGVGWWIATDGRGGRWGHIRRR